VIDCVRTTAKINMGPVIVGVTAILLNVVIWVALVGGPGDFYEVC
jgi:hypothetical protein